MKPISGTNLEQAKSHNRRVLIEAIRTNGPLSRAAIARLTALTTQTVSNIVEELELAMLLTADAPKKILRGQPIRPYSINPDGAYCIAWNILRDAFGREWKELSPTPAEAMPVLAEILLELQQAFPLDRARLLGAGIAMPGRYATEGVTLLSPVTLPGWQDFPVAGKLADRLGMPVLVENDAAAATIGERLYGVRRGLTSFVYLFLGGGIGAGLFLDGQLYKGSRSNAGEIGHMIAVSNGLPCVCGKRGCLDRYVSRGRL